MSGNEKSFFDVILRLSEALVCFRASGHNFLRSIIGAWSQGSGFSRGSSGVDFYVFLGGTGGGQK